MLGSSCVLFVSRWLHDGPTWFTTVELQVGPCHVRMAAHATPCLSSQTARACHTQHLVDFKLVGLKLVHFLFCALGTCFKSLQDAACTHSDLVLCLALQESRASSYLAGVLIQATCWQQVYVILSCQVCNALHLYVAALPFVQSWATVFVFFFLQVFVLACMCSAYTSGAQIYMDRQRNIDNPPNY